MRGRRGDCANRPQDTSPPTDSTSIVSSALMRLSGNTFQLVRNQVELVSPPFIGDCATRPRPATVSPYTLSAPWVESHGPRRFPFHSSVAWRSPARRLSGGQICASNVMLIARPTGLVMIRTTNQGLWEGARRLSTRRARGVDPKGRHGGFLCEGRRALWKGGWSPAFHGSGRALHRKSITPCRTAPNGGLDHPQRPGSMPACVPSERTPLRSNAGGNRPAIVRT